MRHSLVAFTALGFAFIVGDAALAADLPIEPPIYQLPVRARAYSWTGFYFGGNVGGAWGHSTNPTTVSGGYFDAAEALAVNAVGAQVTKSSGYIAGGQAGFNWQAGGFLAGVEADFNYFGLRGSSAVSGIYPSRAPAGFQITTSISTDWLATFRGRFGFVWDNWLFFGTGGVAFASLRGDFAFSDNCGTVGGCPIAASAIEAISLSETRVGYAVGAGIEAGFASQWTIKAEYLFVSFGNITGVGSITTPAIALAASNSFTHDFDLQSHILRLGVNYLFAL
jgi:outer membrane immunogenic protein